MVYLFKINFDSTNEQSRLRYKSFPRYNDVFFIFSKKEDWTCLFEVLNIIEKRKDKEEIL